MTQDVVYFRSKLCSVALARSRSEVRHKGVRTDLLNTSLHGSWVVFDLRLLEDCCG